MQTEIDLILRKLNLKDLDSYTLWNHPSREFHKYNGPYYKKKTLIELEKQVNEWRTLLLISNDDILENERFIVNKKTDELIGSVSWYWKSQETYWLEIGIVVFNEKYWGQGIGFSALKIWITQIFETKPEIIRIGLTTWSGNERMMKLAEKLNMKKEATYRKARIVNGKYYDSISYGILQTEWNEFLKLSEYTKL